MESVPTKVPKYLLGPNQQNQSKQSKSQHNWSQQSEWLKIGDTFYLAFKSAKNII